MLFRARSISSKLNKAQEEVKINMNSVNTHAHMPSLFGSSNSTVQSVSADIVHAVKSATVEDIENPTATDPAVPPTYNFTPGKSNPIASSTPAPHKKVSPPAVYGKND